MQELFCKFHLLHGLIIEIKNSSYIAFDRLEVIRLWLGD